MKKTLLLPLTFLLLAAVAPTSVAAESIDTKIDDQSKKIEDIAQNEEAAKQVLAELDTQIKTITADYHDTLSNKQKQEKEVNQLAASMTALQMKIKKRTAQLTAQARDTQTNSQTNSILTVLLTAESVSDALSKALAVNTIVHANNAILTAQQADKKELSDLQIERTKTLKALEKKTRELAEKETLLAENKLEQTVKIKEISAHLASATAEKNKFIKEKETAEKQKAAQLKALAQAKKKAAEQQAAAEKKAQEQLQKNQEQPKQTASLETPPEAATSQKTEETADTPKSQPSANTSETQETKQTTPTPSTNSGGWAAPTGSLTISSGFGSRPDPTGISGTFHDGIDFTGASGTPITATRAGEVVSANYAGMAGNHVVIKHDNGYYSYYLHMSSLQVSAGQTVSAGQILGGMGTTGNSTGVHLHFSISTGLWSGFVNPAPFLGL